MRKLGVLLVAVLFFAPSTVLLGVATLLNPAATATCCNGWAKAIV